MAAPQRQLNSVLERGPQIERAGAEVIADNRFVNSSDEIDPNGRQDRAQTYLRRGVTLTGATQIGNAYVLDVGNTRFHVRDKYVSRLRDVTDPKCTDGEACFYLVHKGMPKTEEIVTALLQLTNSPALFDRWAAQIGAVEADGPAVHPCAMIGSR